MAAPATLRGLSPADQDQIKTALAAGRRPKVVFTNAAGQIAGQVGQVVALGNPRVDDEWITVRFGKDELPFSPADLTLPTRGAAGRQGPAKPAGQTGKTPAGKTHGMTPSGKAPAQPSRVSAPAGKTPTQPSKPSQPDAPPAGRHAAAVPARAATKSASTKPVPEKPVLKPAEPEFVLDQPIKPAKEPQGPQEPSTPQESAPKERRTAKKAKPPASLVVTLSYSDGDWTLAATQGAKALAKPYVITAAEALRMVGMVDLPTVQEAVAAIIATERAEAQDRAERLRAELADIEARLAELGSSPVRALAP